MSSREWSTKTQACAYLISAPVLLEANIERFLEDEKYEWRRTPGATDAEQLVEFSGRVCYMSFGASQSPRTNAEYIANLRRQGHDSVLEHSNWTVLLTGVSRAFTHQLVRHRAGFSYSQLSQQYHDETEAKFVTPLGIVDRPDLVSAWQDAAEESRRTYRRLISALHTDGVQGREQLRGVRSAARSALLEATATTIVVTANARAWRHFLRVRGSIEGDLEMRVVSALILHCLASSGPQLFSDFSEVLLDDGWPSVIVQSEDSDATR
jgi:thymidylate synthase (FAD)